MIRDNELCAAGVVFLPWIGSTYSEGFRGQKLLILGEAHYDWETRKQEVPNSAELTRFVLIEQRSKGTWGFWGQIESACTGVARTTMNPPSSFWDQVAFYNFIQEFPADTTARAKPSKEQFEAGRKPFRCVLEALRPGRVIVCGYRLWSGMEEIPKEDRLNYDIQAYRLNDGFAVWCMATYHPSSGRYRPQELSPKIWQFLDAPQSIPPN
jgi:hypothetical protein